MFFEASTKNLFRCNIVAKNDCALTMFANSTDNTFTENNFIDNLNLLTLVGKRTGSRWSDAGKGNYWSSYAGYDLDSDGVGDVPMKIQDVFSYLEARKPNLRLYLYSPASQALAVAAGAFPIIDVSSEVDGRPLMKPVDLHDVGVSAGVRKLRPSALHRAGLMIGIPLSLASGFVLMRLYRARGRKS
jgi:nitrous oxidase accessory protein